MFVQIDVIVLSKYIIYVFISNLTARYWKLSVDHFGTIYMQLNYFYSLFKYFTLNNFNFSLSILTVTKWVSFFSLFFKLPGLTLGNCLYYEYQCYKIYSEVLPRILNLRTSLEMFISQIVPNGNRTRDLRAAAEVMLYIAQI